MAGCCEEKHGGYGIHTRRLYSDRRSREGKRLATIMKGLVSDLGGEAKLNMAQRLLLDGIRSKIIIQMQISKFIDMQMDNLVSKEGELSPILKGEFNMYAESIRRDLESMYLMKRSIKHSDYEKAIKHLQGKDA